MITFTMPTWFVWMIVAGFVAQWIMNAVLAFYKKKCADAWQELSKATKLALGGEIKPGHWKGQ